MASENTHLSFRDGASLPFRALAFLLKRPKYWPAVIAPLAINTVIFVALLGWGFSELADGLHGWLDGREGWHWPIIVWTARVLFWLIALIAVYFLFTPIALLIAAPFNDWLSERAEAPSGLTPVERNGSIIRTLGADALFAIVAESQRLLYFAAVSVAILGLNFIPIIGPVLFTIVSFYWASRYAAFEFTCYCADRRHMRWKDSWAMLRENRSVSLGYGITTVLLMMIPFINVLVVTVSAVGGTFLFAEMRNAEPRSPRAVPVP